MQAEVVRTARELTSVGPQKLCSPEPRVRRETPMQRAAELGVARLSHGLDVEQFVWDLMQLKW